MRKKISIILLIIALITGLYSIRPILATSTALSASSKSVNSGEEFEVSISSSIILTGWTISLSDNGGCTYISASVDNKSTGEVNGNGVYGMNSGGTKSLATYKFKAPTVSEDKTFYIKFSGTAMCDIDMNELDDPTPCTAKITVKAPEQKPDPEPEVPPTDEPNTPSEPETPTEIKKSNNANLSNLGIKPNDFTGFKPNKTSYTVTVPNEVETIEVYATKQDKNATVSGTGKNKKLEIGDNTFEVVVTAEDGTTKKTYKLVVTREEAKVEEPTAPNEENPTDEPENPEETTPPEEENTTNGLALTKLSIIGLTSKDSNIETKLKPQFSPDVYEYTMEVSSDVDSLKVESTANSSEAIIEVMGNKNLVVGENIVTILVKLANSEETATYQITVTKKEKVAAAVGKTDSNKMIIMGIAAGAVIVILVGIVVVRNIMKKRREEDDFEDEYADELPGGFTNFNSQPLSEVLAEERKVNENKEEENLENKNEQPNEVLEEDYDEEYHTDRKRRSGKRFK